MSSEESLVAQYIAKVMAVQEKHKSTNLDKSDIESIRKEMELTDEDLAYINGEFKGHLYRGIGFLKYKNYYTAVKELEQAIALKPYHEGALVSLSAAYQQLFNKERKAVFKTKSIDFSHRCLQSYPLNEDAIRIISQLENPKRRLPSRKMISLKLVAAMVVFAMLLFAGSQDWITLGNLDFANVFMLFGALILIFAIFVFLLGVM